MAKKRKVFRRKPKTRTIYRKAKKVYRRKSKGRGIFPLSVEDMAIGFAAGAITRPLSDALKPAQDKYLGTFGEYSDEAALAIAGTIAHKFGGRLPMVKKLGKEIFRVAVISTGQGLGSGMVSKMMGTTTANGNNTALNPTVF